MSTSMSTPASLATFTQPHASTSKLPHVSLNTVDGGDGTSAVAAVQGDGIWTYDLRIMRPTTSFTVPPSTTFALPPISFHHKSRGKEKAKAQDEAMDIDGTTGGPGSPSSERYTAVVIDKAEGLTKNAQGKVLWIWSGDDATHTQATLEERIVGLHRISLVDKPILAVHSASSYSLVSPDNAHPPQRITLSKTEATGDILATEIQSTSPEHTSIVVVDVSGHWVLLTFDGPSGAIKGVVQKEGKLIEGKRIFKSASISKDGVVTAIDSEDRLVSKSINEGLHTIHPTLTRPTTPTLCLSLPSFGKPLVILPALHPTPSILVVVPSATSPALLASVSVTSSAVNTTITDLALLGQTAPNVLVIGIVLHHGGDDGGRSVVYTCEVTVPEKGIGLNALLGSSARTEEYLSISAAGSSSKQVNGTAEIPEEKVVGEITALLAKGDTKAASTRLDKALAGQKDQLSEKTVKKLVNVIFSTALPGLGKETESENKKRGPYAPGLIRPLLERRMINDEMIKGGVVASALLPLEDWDNIFIALPLLRTIPASALIALIKASLDTTTPKTPSIETVLKAILALPSPAPTYRLELKRGLNVEEATSVLEVLVDFAESWVSQNAKGIEWDTTSHGPVSHEETASLPSLDSVITHSSHLLDSHTPLFLGHPPSYPLLTRMQAALEPLLHMQADYRALRAPLDAVLTLSKRAERDRDEKQKKNTLLNGAYAKRGGQRSATSMAQGKREGQGMGEAKVGKWQVEDFAF